MKVRGLFDRHNYGELTYIAHNCEGQNKNKIVLGFLMWLAEVKLFPKVSICFLARGYTKNSADRLFNLLKLDYHKKCIHIQTVS